MPQTSDFPKEDFVVEQLKVDVTFRSDGTGQEDRAGRIKIQSNAAIKTFGVLSFPYNSAFERLEIREIRVKKTDGTEIKTAESDAQDVATEATRLAPSYTDTRTKQIPVKGLGVGDTLHFQVRTVRTIAQVPGHFWYTHDFFDEGIILDETLTVHVPSGKYVNVSSPDQTPNIDERDGNVTYSWKTSRTTATSSRPVRLTTFRSWQELGQWYAGLQNPQVAVTTAIQTKATELTRDLNTNVEKERAIYQFVATKFRYVSVSFGAGRYQPHSAEEVLTNQYGDCKDKHTLMAALLKAAGIDAWPVLIGTNADLDPDIASPDGVNHLITYIPGQDGAVWLDTTPEIAPFGMLVWALRNRKALVIPSNAEPVLMTTPEIRHSPPTKPLILRRSCSPTAR